jgi:hypothetical protein
MTGDSSPPSGAYGQPGAPPPTPPPPPQAGSDDTPTPARPGSDASPILRRAAKWVGGAIGVAFLGGAGTALWQAVQDKAEDITGPGAVAVNVRVDPAYWKEKRPNWVPYFYYIPRDRSELSAPPGDCRDRREWAWQQAGSDADETRLALTLTGRESAQVSLDGMAVEIVSRETVTGGVVAACPVGAQRLYTRTRGGPRCRSRLIRRPG